VFQLSKKVEYGLIALLHLDALGAQSLVTAKEMAESYRIPGEILGKVLQALARNKVLASVHGAKGGYRLARPIEDLALGDVIEAVEGPVHLARCQDDPASCDQFCSCNIREPVERIQAQLTKFMHNIKLSSFRRSSHVPGVPFELV